MKEFVAWFWDNILDEAHTMYFRAENKKTIYEHSERVYKPQGLELLAVAERKLCS